MKMVVRPKYVAEIWEKRNTTKNSHETNTQEDKDESYNTADTTARTVDVES
jgi:hypothetical protein